MKPEGFGALFVISAPDPPVPLKVILRARVLLHAAALVAPVKRIALVTKPIPSVAFDARHAEALLGLLAPLIQPMIDVAVANALQKYREDQHSSEPEVYTLTEACQRIKMGKSKFHALRKKGLAPKYFLCGKEYRFTKAALDKWLADEHEHVKSAEAQLEHERRSAAAKIAAKKTKKSLRKRARS